MNSTRRECCWRQQQNPFFTFVRFTDRKFEFEWGELLSVIDLFVCLFQKLTHLITFDHRVQVSQLSSTILLDTNRMKPAGSGGGNRAGGMQKTWWTFRTDDCRQCHPRRLKVSFKVHMATSSERQHPNTQAIMLAGQLSQSQS